jgi:hypothetical protein
MPRTRKAHAFRCPASTRLSGIAPREALFGRHPHWVRSGNSPGAKRAHKSQRHAHSERAARIGKHPKPWHEARLACEGLAARALPASVFHALASPESTHECGCALEKRKELGTAEKNAALYHGKNAAMRNRNTLPKKENRGHRLKMKSDANSPTAVEP